MILCVFRIRRVYKGSFFLLSTDSTYSCIPGDNGGLIFFRHEFFLALVLCTNWCTTIYITYSILCKIVQFLRKIECIKFVCNKFVRVVNRFGIFGWYFVGISWYLPNQYRRKTRSLHFGIIILAGTPFFLKRGVMAPFFRGPAPVLWKIGFPTKP